MNTWKRFLAMALALCLILSLVPAAYAEDIEAPVSEAALEIGSDPVIQDGLEVQTAETKAADEEELEVKDYETFLENLKVLESYATAYQAANKGKNYTVSQLVVNYVRTGVERYMEGLWSTIAGEEITDFVNYVADQDEANGTTVRCLRNIVIDDFTLPNGDLTDFGHMFGTLNIAYITVQATGDLGGWAGDICDLLTYSKNYGTVPAGTVDEMAAYILENCFGVNADDAFGWDDFYGDMDAYYINTQLKLGESISQVFEKYFTEDLDNADRAAFFMNDRFYGMGLKTQEDVREAVYEAYTSNQALAVLEADRGLSNEHDLRQACCYAFADYLFSVAGDRLTGEVVTPDDPEEPDDPTDPEDPEDPEDPGEDTGNPYYTVFSSEASVLAPGISQEINYAMTADEKQIVYYVATVDVNRDDVTIMANYKGNDPSQGWGMERVIDQANAMVERHTDPEKYPDLYIENFNAIVATNADGYNMSTGEPGGLLVMEGKEWYACDNHGFFAILKDGTAMIGTKEDYELHKDQIQEGVGAFGATLVKDGEIAVAVTSDYYTARHSRTAIGITADGKVVMMVLDGRQEPFSAGGSMLEIAQIMYDAGCVEAVNLDGGGSTTYAAKLEGSDSLSLVNRPSDGYARSVSTSLVAVSTAKSSNEFDHANITTEYDYLTVGTELTLEAVGVSGTGNAAPIPEGALWQLSDDTVGAMNGDVFTAAAEGDVDVKLVLPDGRVAATKTLHVVTPDSLVIGAENINVIYGIPSEIPLVATYGGNAVGINPDDITFLAENETAGTFDGLTFTGDEASGIRVTYVYAILSANDNIYDTVRVCLFNEDEAMFDFEDVTAGDRVLAYKREVSNSYDMGDGLFQVAELGEDMEISYTFGLDMTAIEIPEQIAGLVYMLPGGDNPNATAWDFLLQLAERVSVRSEVRVNMQFDPNLDVDITNLRVSCEYFTLTTTEFDPETNTLTLVANWVDQTQAIPAETANPICILSGIKAVPKEDAQWDDTGRLAVTNQGTVDYKIYLRANALYSFASQESNQQTYELFPFEHTDIIINGATEKGGYFEDTYGSYNDTITLKNSPRSGWVSMENFLYYYVDNEPVTGIQRLPGYEDPSKMYFYSFNEDGSLSQSCYGLLEYDGKLYYTVAGEAKTGWRTYNDADGTVQFYYFAAPNGEALDGNQTIDGYTYTFENCKLVRGQIVTDANGSRYMWAGSWAYNSWLEIDGKTYFAGMNNYFYTGLRKQYSPEGVYTHYAFAEDGHLLTEYTGFYDNNGKIGFIRAGIYDEYPGIVFVDGYYYYVASTGVMVKNGDYYCSKTNGLMPEGRYFFDAMGRMTNPPDGSYVPDENSGVKNGFVTENGALYYYNYGVMFKGGLFVVDGHYYYASTSTGKLIVGQKYWISVTNGLMPQGSYYFDSEGRMEIEHTHSYTSAVTTEATHFAPGVMTYTCLCGHSYTEAIAQIPHSYTSAVTVEPGYSAPGVMTYTCSCGHSYTEAIPALENPFADAEPNRFYYTPVMWAVDNGVTQGTSATEFSPDASCTRAQFVTFLWRLAGKPEPKSLETPFTDLNPRASYYKAVLWAAEEGITSGVSATKFGPGEICTRGHVVTFLWRYAGKPAPADSTNPFKDVETGRFYFNAVLWAAENGITSGISATKFDPDGNCTRGQTVTFLYRYAVEN